jgi:hypothetical protein
MAPQDRQGRTHRQLSGPQVNLQDQLLAFC